MRAWNKTIEKSPATASCENQRPGEGAGLSKLHPALAAVRMGIRGNPILNRGVRSLVPDQAKMISPSVRVRAWKPASSFAVTGPGLPVPMTRPSTFTTGMISAAVPVRNISSAL